MSIATGEVATGTAAAVYTSSGATAVTWASFTNFSGGAITLSLYVVPAADVAGGAQNEHLVLDTDSLSDTETFSLYAAGEKLLLDNGDAIFAIASSGSSINYVVSYTSI
jgi:hypothetical protein